ncbi:MAG: diguanylate cyclase [Anaerolineae bacterium]|nr:diguanylate cyclase [Gloeobacterales cyanobacterium ES-bin-313]
MPEPVGEELELDLRSDLKSRQGKSAVLYIDLRNFRLYNQLYGRVAGEQMIHTLAGAIEHCLDEAGTIHRLGGHEFIAVTNNDHSEQLAQDICHRWDRDSLGFYTRQDRQRGFLVGIDRHGIGRRCSLVEVNIGIIDTEHYQTLSDIFSAALRANLVAQTSKGSSYACVPLDTDQPPEKPTPHRVLVVEPDAALAYLLQTTLELRGYAVAVTSSGQEAFKLAITNPPRVIVLDLFTSDLPAGPFLCQELRRQPELKNTLLIVAATNADREDALVAGADLFVPKPFELDDLLGWIDRLVEEYAKTVDLPSSNRFRGFRR